jgi:TolB-like protein/DNA-binding winged helix-turn-helix (wHTH) protein
MLRFGVFELDRSSGELKKSGVVVKLQLQPAKVLALLASEPGRLFTRQEIQERLWPPDTHVDFEQGLNYCIKEIRAALGDRADKPAYVETLARRGYRFVAPVETAQAAEPSPVTEATTDNPPAPAFRVGWVRVAAAALVLVGMAVGGIVLARSTRSDGIVVAVLPYDNLTGDPDYDLFAHGLTEETQLQLRRLQPGPLAVIARTTTRGYAQRPHPIAELADDLGVDYVVEGTVRRCFKRSHLRVTARLVRTSDRHEVWSDRLEQPLDDVVEMQRALARGLATGAAAALAREEPSLLRIADAPRP